MWNFNAVIKVILFLKYIFKNKILLKFIFRGIYPVFYVEGRLFSDARDS